MMQKSPSAINDSPQKGFCLFRTLFDSSALVTLLTIGIFFGMIQTATSNVILSSSVASTTTSLPKLTEALQTTTRTTTVISSSITSTSSPLIPSYYSGALSSTSGRFTRPGAASGTYYYQAIQVRVSTSGRYSFTSSSSIDTYGCFYSDGFYASFPSQNLIAYDDDSGGSSQFRINVTLSALRSYVLVVTTYSQSIIGTFLVTALGPASLNLFPYMTTTVWPASTTSSSLIPSSYSGTLTLASGIFTRPGGTTGSYYYYQAIRVSTYISGRYSFTSSSSMDTYGYFYFNTFDPSYPYQNLIASDDDSGGSGQFRINVTLSYGSTYILVVTTYPSSTTGAFSVTGLGPASVSLTPMSPTTTTFSGSLTSYSQKFVRPGSSSNSYYFQAIEVTVYTSGSYTFVSVSTIDTYGCFYLNRVDPSYPNQNLIASDDDSAGDRQFRISVSLQAGTTYVLVVTTFSSYTTGSFLVRVSGPALVGLTAITPKPSQNGPDAVIIASIIVLGVIFFAIIFGLCLRRRNRQRTFNRGNILPAQNQYVQPPIYSTTMPNMNQIPNPNSTTRLYGAYVEKPPPAYNSIITNAPPQP